MGRPPASNLSGRANHSFLTGISTRQLTPLPLTAVISLTVVHQAPGAALRPAAKCQLRPVNNAQLWGQRKLVPANTALLCVDLIISFSLQKLVCGHLFFINIWLFS